jgi:Tfp pilus assembly protein PilW
VSKAITQCDLPRRNDLDGRSNLSEEARAAFTLLSRDLHQSGDFYGVADAA